MRGTFPKWYVEIGRRLISSLMPGTSENNKRILKNTAMLYIRMFLTMAVSLYTSRVVLQVLGVEDFGIYNVVGGIIGMLAFFNGSMATATQRFLNYEMGKGHEANLEKVFSVSLISYAGIAFLSLIVAETIGLWFVYNKLVISPDRLSAALWTYQACIIIFVINLFSVPYNATIIAHERMAAFAYIGIMEVLAKLLIAYSIIHIPFDHLITYSFLMCLVPLMTQIIYMVYCHRHFKECRLKWIWDTVFFKKLINFSGWMLAGTSSDLLVSQGVNILINLYFGPLLNAARAVSMQVRAAVSSFYWNFMMAARPQIVKSYAQGNYEYMYKLVYSTTKLSFLMLFLLTLPIWFHTQFILDLWLKHSPEYSTLFVQLVLMELLIACTITPLASLSQASGRIRNYQLIISILSILIFCVTWLFYEFGFPVYSTFLISIVVNFVGVFFRVVELHYSQQFPVRMYLQQVICPIIAYFIIVMGLIFLLKLKMSNATNLIMVISHSLLYVLLAIALSWRILLNNSERQLIKNTLGRVLEKLRF